ncbi:MAG: methylenetetrahydrofolate--tRNA-(uracil(54)-C(5))-methyltransferase (FADH(2)-oxidizing) TrmFO, partial [Oscillospiraceae bacterium]|nr:methylenetetrahydrofolate--tRNA-(uracil(54)-C(5))-methyltransferase (FADH(2)-oxidizing) TrmFO [Oscillospiraceae bacterium]
RLSTAGGLLKAEMRLLSKAGSLTLDVAELVSVPAGGALAVDRAAFSDEITRRITANPNIEVISGEVTAFPQRDAIIATGPLTSDGFTSAIIGALGELGGSELLSFYDAAAPIVTADSIDMTRAFVADRYNKGEGDGDYINCPFTREEYERFYHALITAESAALHGVDEIAVYEGCMPVEVLAKRGIDAVRYGCMKPVGICYPDGHPNVRDNANAEKTRQCRPYANVQLRKENSGGTMYNLVGFQTNLKFGEQKRVFSMIPGLENAEFVRYGVMHRNTFIDSPRLLDGALGLRGADNVRFAGQITGVEGYMESAASGIVAALACMGKLGFGELPNTSMIGALMRYVSDESVRDFQPMGANMGLLPPLSFTIKNKQERYEKLAHRALSDLQKAKQNLNKKEET